VARRLNPSEKEVRVFSRPLRNRSNRAMASLPAEVAR
jgi:hypothetical protein